MLGRFGPLIALLVLLPSATAYAGNEDEFLVGNDAALRGGAVLATVRDGGAVWYNPAGIANVQRDQLDVTSSVYSLRLYRSPNFMSSVQGASTDLSVSEFITAPSQVSYVRPLSDDVSLGLGYFAPRASKLLVRETLDAPGGGFDSRWVADITSTTAEYAFGAAVGFAPSPDLRLGFGLMARWESITEQVDFLGTVSFDGDVLQAIQVGQLLTQDIIGVEPIAGVQWEVNSQLTLGLSLKGPRLSLINSGETSNRVLVADLFQQYIAAETRPEDVSSTPVTLVRWGRYYAGGAYRWGDNLVSLDADIQPKLIHVDAGVKRKLQGNARLGYSRDLSRVTTVGVGLFSDRRADDVLEHSLIRAGGDFYGGTVGVRFSNEHLLAESEQAKSIVFSSVFALRYAFAKAETESLIVDATQTDAVDLFGSGSADLTVHELALYVGSGLNF